jgi:hypothetical protein
MRPNGRPAGDEGTACLPLNNTAATHSSQVGSIAETDLDLLLIRKLKKPRGGCTGWYLVIASAYAFIGAGDEAAGSLVICLSV